jgi:hypothetical protein
MTTGAVPLAPFYGGVAASQHLGDAPLDPVQLTAPAQRPPHQTSSSPARRAPASSPNRSSASPAPNRSSASPAHHTTPRAQTMLPSDQAATVSRFFIVLVGYSPGVYTSM